MTPTAELGLVIVLGVCAQALAARWRIPSILLLLSFGLAAGPGFGIIDPDRLFGNLLLPVVSLSVAVILFEGGLSLRWRELKEIGRPLMWLVSAGALLSWALTVIASQWCLGYDRDTSFLLGAILVVTGPTVIAPLLRHVRLRGNAAALLRWEGIVIDPIGALFAVLMFELVRDRPDESVLVVVWALTKTVICGGGLGWLLSVLLVRSFQKFQLPDTLHVPVTLAAVILAFISANAIQDEAGLLAVTVMGIAVANQKRTPIKHLQEFKENLTVLLISVLFILLSARLPRSAMAEIHLGAVAFLLALLLIRLLVVAICTWGSKLNFRERLFVSCLAPRGIVAASVASIFALKLAHASPGSPDQLTPMVFWTIIGTVSIYGLAAKPLANRLKLAVTNPQGTIFVGAHAWGRALASCLRDQGKPVVMVDSSWSNVMAARLAQIPAVFGSVLSEDTLEEIELGEMRRFFALTANDELNSLACLRLIEVVGRQHVYQLPFTSGYEGKREAIPPEQRGRFLMGPEQTYSAITHWCGPQPVAKATMLTPDFTFESYRKQHGDGVLPILVILENGDIVPINADAQQAPKPGQKVISLLRHEGAPASGNESSLPS